MDRKLLVTVSGPPAVGTSSLCDETADEFDARVLSGGDIFRNIADERGLTAHELSEVAEVDNTIDKKVDNRLKQRIREYIENRESQDSHLIVDSRLAGWHADGEADLAIWLQAPIDVRIQRIKDREETEEQLRKRESSDARRYMEYYNIDIDDMSVYDLVIDTDTFSQKETVDIAKQALKSVS